MLGVTNIYAIFLAYIKEKLASLITLTRSMCGQRAENTRHMGIISLIKTNIFFTFQHLFEPQIFFFLAPSAKITEFSRTNKRSR